MKLHLLIGRLSGPIQLLGLKVYSYLFHVPRARVLVWNEDGELLLVRSWGAGTKWGLPGGGVEKAESAAEAAKRELYEELGLDVPLADFSYVTTIICDYEAPIFSATVARGDLPAAPHNPREIVALGWFSVKSLPTDVSPLVILALKNLSKAE